MNKKSASPIRKSGLYIVGKMSESLDRFRFCSQDASTNDAFLGGDEIFGLFQVVLGLIVTDAELLLSKVLKQLSDASIVVMLVTQLQVYYFSFLLFLLFHFFLAV